MKEQWTRHVHVGILPGWRLSEPFAASRHDFSPHRSRMTPPDIPLLDVLATAAEVTGSVLLALDTDHRIFFWNRAAESLYGVRREDVIGLDYVETFIVPAQRAAIAADIRKVLAGEPTWEFEDDSVVADGTARTLVWNVARVLDRDGVARGIIASGYDITARKEAERAFRLVWDQSTEGLLLGGGPGIIDCNPTALAMLGLTDSSQLIGRHPLEFSPEFQPDGSLSRDKARRMDALTRALGENRFEWMHRRVDGTPVPTAVHVKRSLLDGRMITVIAWLDLTEQHAVAALQSRLLRSQKLDALGHLAGGIAHDFNNLLSAIRGSLDLAMLDVAPQSAAAVELAVAQDTTVRAANLVRQLLTFGRQGESAHDVFDLAARVRSAEPLLRRLLPPAVSLTIESCAEQLFVWGDASQIEQVVVNLLVNARDALTDGGDITLRVSDATGGGAACARLEMIDTGPGMAPELLDRVFDPFFTTKPVGTGTGLGLAVVYGVVSAHDGTVQIESSVGAGTTVRVDLPLVPAPEAALPADSVPDDSDTTAMSSTGAVVLLVEDEPAVRRTLARLLERDGHTVLTATHGAEALTVWHSNEAIIRVVVSDVRMPVMSGPEFVRQLRSAGSRLPVVLMSGFADTELTRALPPGVTDVLSKPFVAGDLLRAVKAAVVGEGVARDRPMAI